MSEYHVPVLLEQSIEKQKIHAPQIGYGLHGQRKSAKP